MSRSRKKNPVIGICRAPNGHSNAKRQMVKRTRIWLKNQEELLQNSTYKKFHHDWAWRPDDGRQRVEDYPKAYRK